MARPWSARCYGVARQREGSRQNSIGGGYTSGTTGFPKGCVNPHREFADCLRRIATIYGITEDDRELVAAPLFHEAPALFALLQIFRGGTVIVTSDSTPANVFELIDRNEATWTFMVPTMWATTVASEIGST